MPSQSLGHISAQEFRRTPGPHRATRTCRLFGQSNRQLLLGSKLPVPGGPRERRDFPTPLASVA